MNRRIILIVSIVISATVSYAGKSEITVNKNYAEICAITEEYCTSLWGTCITEKGKSGDTPVTMFTSRTQWIPIGAEAYEEYTPEGEIYYPEMQAVVWTYFVVADKGDKSNIKIHVNLAVKLGGEIIERPSNNVLSDDLLEWLVAKIEGKDRP